MDAPSTEFLVAQRFDQSTKQFVCNDKLLTALLSNEELTTIKLQIKMITEELVEYLCQILFKSNVKSLIIRLHGLGQMQAGFKDGEIYACTLDEDEIAIMEPLQIYGKYGENKLTFASDCHAIWCVGAEVTDYMNASFNTELCDFTDTTHYFLQELSHCRATAEPVHQR